MEAEPTRSDEARGIGPEQREQHGIVLVAVEAVGADTHAYRARLCHHRDAAEVARAAEPFALETTGDRWLVARSDGTETRDRNIMHHLSLRERSRSL